MEKNARDNSLEGKRNKVVIYERFCFDVAQCRMNGAPYENRTHSWMFACIAGKPLHHSRCPKETK